MKGRRQKGSFALLSQREEAKGGQGCRQVGRQVRRCRGQGGTDGDVLGVDAGVQKRVLPAVQVLLSLAGQVQAAVVLVHVPAKKKQKKQASR